MIGGLILLDDEQQRVLYAPPPPPSSAMHQRPHRQPRPLPHALRHSSAPSSVPSSAPSGHPSALSANHGLPRTNVTTNASLGKPSFATVSSSPRSTHDGPAYLVGGGGGGGGLLLHHDGSYPILRDDDDAASSSGDSDRDAAHRYAGTSSGLKISVSLILAGVGVGVALGVLLSQLHVSSDAARWVSLPGDLFLRALKCLVIPYVFCAVAVAIGDIVFVGKVSIVGVQTFRMFALFWVSSAAIGMAIALLFRPLFRVGALDKAAAASVNANAMGVTCANGLLLATSSGSDGRVACSVHAASASTSASFVVTDVHSVFATSSASASIAQLDLTEQLIAIIQPVVSSNIFASVATGGLLPTITFSMVLGAIAGRSYFQRTRRVNYLYLLLLQLRNTFFLAMEWTIWLSPGAVVSMIAGSFAANQQSLDQFSRLYVYVLAGLAAAVLQMLVVFPLIVFLLTRCNPYHHMRKMLRAYVFAFACSSSLATAPVTLACVKKAQVCSQSLANFVIAIGVCSNLSAVGWYIPIATVFIAESSGSGDQLTALRLVGIFVLAVLQCAGTAPIPSGVLVSIATIYTTLFGVAAVPATFAYVAAMDFIIDRLVTVCDVNDDIMCLKVVAENTDETVTQEHLGERE